MELNWILIWISGVSTAMNLVAAVRGEGAAAWGWRAVLTTVLVLLGALWITVPAVAGFVIGPVWLLVVLLPGLLLRWANRLLSQRKYRRADWIARIASWLHPCDGWPQQWQLVRAMRLFEEGRATEATAMLSKLEGLDTGLGQTARLIQAQQTGDWTGLLEAIDRRFSRTSVLHNEPLLGARVHALGELGRRREMLLLLQAANRVRPPGGSQSWSIMQMRAAALCGEQAATAQQLSMLTDVYAPEVHTFWQLTARQVAGDAGATDGFRQLLSNAGSYLRPMIERRLSQPLPAVDRSNLDQPMAELLGQLRARIAQDVALADEHRGGLRRPWATWSIAGILLVAFLVEIPGGSTNPDNLIEWGALVVPQSLTPGEWWRVLTAGLLHFGPLHLGLNLLGLLALGPRLERAWGRVPMFVCYVAATITSMSLAPQVMSLLSGPPLRILVGASGGMMGLLGGLVGYSAVNWLRHRNDQTKRPLVFLLGIIALQTTFDLSTPNVSFVCHSLGLLTGFIFGCAWTGLRPAQR